MSRTVLTAYGRPSDRDKLTVLAQRDGSSASELILKLVRDQYSKLYGDTPPEALLRINRT